MPLIVKSVFRKMEGEAALKPKSSVQEKSKQKSTTGAGVLQSLFVMLQFHTGVPA